MYQGLLLMSPGLEERLNTGSEQDVHYVADMVSVYRDGLASLSL